MGRLYSWATKEYILYKMSMGQLVLYYNLGVEQVYGKTKETIEQEKQDHLRQAREEMYETGILERDPTMVELASKYGDIEDAHT